MGNILPLSNVIVVSATQGNPGVGNYNTSNLAIFTDDAPVSAVTTVTFVGVAASGAFELAFGGVAMASTAWNATLATIQANINAVAGMGQIVVSGSLATLSLVLTWNGQLGPLPVVTVAANTLQTAGSVAVTTSVAINNAGWSGGTLGYAQYLTPTQTDFATASKTTAMINAVFSQQPNILVGGGQLVVILLQTASQNVVFSAVPTSGNFELAYNSNATATIAWNAVPSAIATALQAVTGLSGITVSGSIAGNTLQVQFTGVYGAALLMTVPANTLNGSITITPTVVIVGETIGAAVTRTASLVQYFGILVNESVGTGQVIPAADVQAAAAVVQALVKIIFFATNSSTDLTATTGLCALITLAGQTQCRMLYYGDTTAGGVGVANALNFSAGYAGRFLSVNFSGSNTTLTMHLQPITNTVPDPNMTQTILNQAGVCGADCYINLQGDPCCFISGANQFSDRVYNRLWFSGALQVAGFNYLATVGTKVPQTENGMIGLKGAYYVVCQQAVTNGYLAPGSWNSATTFGNSVLLIQNVAQFGFYQYSTPIAQQSQATRVTRAAPLVQIAAKEAGAIQSSTVIVTINP